jgi:hypothetical protein|tara:strand:+ start:499 stop:765 length:267 start_codon:yes stop_codon:yes gene_type:complete
MFAELEYHQWFVAKVHFHWRFVELDYCQWFVAKVHFQWMFEEMAYYVLIVATVYILIWFEAKELMAPRWTKTVVVQMVMVMVSLALLG